MYIYIYILAEHFGPIRSYPRILLNGALCPLKRPDDRFRLHVAKSETGQLTDPRKSVFSENTRSP